MSIIHNRNLQKIWLRKIIMPFSPSIGTAIYPSGPWTISYLKDRVKPWILYWEFVINALHMTITESRVATSG